jgi:Tol biopolymer transport system component
MKTIFKQLILTGFAASLLLAFSGVANAAVEIHVQSTNAGYLTTGISDGDLGTMDIDSLGTPAATTTPTPPVAVRYDFDARGNPTETPATYGLNDMTGATTVSLNDDATSEDIPIGFNTTLFGRNNDTIKIGSNGFVYLNQSAVTSNDSRCCGGNPTSSITGPDFMVAGAWTDLYPPGSPSGTDAISYKTFGTAPERYMVVAFNDVSPCCESSGGNTFQIKLFETPTAAPAVTDNDSDGIPDATDNCPSVPNPGQENSDSATATAITTDAAMIEAKLSPDRNKIMFTSNKSGHLQIYDTNADGSSQRNLSNNTANDDMPVYNANGTKIAFRSDRDTDQTIWIMNADGSNQTRLTDPVAGNHDSAPIFSPDGSKIAFQTSRDGNAEIYIMGSDGSNPTRLTNNTANDYTPYFNHDGSKIYFYSDRGDNVHYEIYSMDANGANQTALTANSNITDPATIVLSPNGSKIAFQNYKDGNAEIYTMNENGSNQTRVTNNTGLDLPAAFSADNTKIAFTSNMDGNLEAYVMDINGSNLHRLTDNPANDYALAFNENGNKLLFSSDRAVSGTLEIYSTNVNQDNIGDACDCQSDGICTAINWCAVNATPDPDCGVIPTAPSAITDLTAQPGTGTTVDLRWSAPTDNNSTITDYLIEENDGRGWTTFDDGISASATANVTGLTNFHNYSFRVRAVNGIGNGDYSNTARAIPEPCGPMDVNNQTGNNPLTTLNGECLGLTVTPGALTLEHSPLSLSFPLKFSAMSPLDSFSNDNPLTTNIVDVSTSPDDILTISDMRNSGGFRINITATPLSNGTDTIPLSNLYVATSYPDDNDFSAPINDNSLYGAKDSGIEWATGSIGAHDITTPAFTTNPLSLKSTYTTMSSFDQNHDNTPDAITLMETNTAHAARMSQALSFYMNIPANQPSGTYATTFTIDLIAL